MAAAAREPRGSIRGSAPVGGSISGLVFNIQKYSLNDGPGIRTTVFLKGCPLCCAWCHNPEGIQPRCEVVTWERRCAVCGDCREACPVAGALEGEGPLPMRVPGCLECAACVEACPTGARQMVGRRMAVGEVLREVLQDRVFYEDSGGGVTISGGEPLMQPRFLVAVLEACRAVSLHAVLDTTGFGRQEDLLAAARLAELVMYDLKAFDEERHRRLTGVSNRRILANLEALDRAERNLWIRVPVVPGYNDDLDDLREMARFVQRLKWVRQVSLLPFHRTGLHKFQRLGLAHALEGVERPSACLLERIRGLFDGLGFPVQVGG